MQLRSILRHLGVLVGLVVTFYIVVWGALLLLARIVPEPKVPSDAALANQFYTNQEAFAELKEMLMSTGSTKREGTNEAQVAAGRMQRYDKLLRRTKVLRVIHDGPELRFIVAASGFASKGYRIAIVWRETAPSHTIATLDDFHNTTTGKWQQAYRPLGNNWYLWIIW